MSNVIPFDFEEHGVRVVLDDAGETWFVLADVCRVLGHSNPTVAASRLDDDEKNTLNITEGNRGNPELIVISESGLYSLILTSRKPEAKRFKRWVTHEVLPAIRRTGSYRGAGEERPDLEALLADQRDRIRLLEENARLRDRAREVKISKEIWSVAARMVRETELSDAEIAGLLAGAIGEVMPEWVAFVRRRNGLAIEE